MHYMFGGNVSVPITIRLIIGRGWGRVQLILRTCNHGSHIFRIKVVVPTTPEDAKGLLIESGIRLNPVIFLEHRWLHNSIGS